MKRMGIWFVATVFCAVLAHAESRGKDQGRVQVRIDMGRPVRTLSKYLTGSHFVYAFERDSLYRDERITDWMRRSKVNVIRWPGGTAVQNYHWDELNGIAFKEDSWDPDYQAQEVDPENYMDLDEYIAFCRKVGAEPMVGVNIKSGKKYKREADALEEARRLITYCRDQKYNVKFWYIGNECFKGFTPSRYAQYIDRYAEVLRSVDPGIVVIGDWKFAQESKNRFAQSVEVATSSEQLDVLDIHEKWGNDWSLSTGGAKSDWRKECPLYDGKLGDYIRKFHQAMKDAGRPQVKLALNEWGIGTLTDGNEFDQALVAADYLIEVFRNDVYQACYWNLNMGSQKTRVLATADRKSRLLALNPVSHIFEMFAHALGKELLVAESSEGCVYGFAVREPENVLQCYLLNKNTVAASVELNIENAEFDQVQVRIESFVSPGVMETTDLGESDVSRPLRIDLSPSSFSRILVEKK